MGKITDRTLIPIGLAVVVIGGSSIWLTKISILQSAQGDAIEELRVSSPRNVEKIDKILRRLDRRLMGIEVKLGIEPVREDN